MDEFEDRLKRDAEKIRADISPELRLRIDASLRATEQIRPVPESGATGTNLWWASSLTGLAAAVLVIVLINWNQPVTEVTPPAPVASQTVPDYIGEIQSLYLPRVKTAEFTKPLEEELARLQADIERARENVKEDVAFTF
jgi:hypothetical protein